MDIFVISLERSKDRRNQFDSYNAKYITYTYHNAVDGYTLNTQDLGGHIMRKGTVNYSKGAIGCALSHLELWEKCIELQKPIIVLEDDAIVNKDFMKHINNLMNNLAPKKWDIIQLNYNMDSVLSYKNTCYETSSCIFKKTSVTNEHIETFRSSKINTTLVPLLHCFGMSAYIIHPDGAKLFKERCFPLDNEVITLPFLNPIGCYTIDCKMNSLYNSTASYVTIVPFVMTPHISDFYKTTIV